MATITDTPVLHRHRLSRSDVERMVDVGVLGEDDRVELIDGELIEIAPIGSRHAGTLDQLAASLSRAAGTSAIVRVQNPVALDPDSEPQPDLMLLKPRNDYYKSAFPGPADILLLVEIADSSIAYDREVKLPLYARHGIAEFWLLDLKERRLLIHRAPRADRSEYSRIDIRHDGIVSPEALPGAAIDLDALLA